MTNKELLEIMELAEENKVNHDTLRRLLKILENSEGRIGKLKYLRKLLKEETINDINLLSIFERVYAGKNTSWASIMALNNHVLLKNHIMNTDYTKEELSKVAEVVEQLLTKEVDGMKDKIYIRELKNLRLKGAPLVEYDFLNEIYIGLYNCELINSNWLFSYLLNAFKPLEERKKTFRLLKANMLSVYPEVKINNMESKARKILETYELYGYDFANTYATLIICTLDIDVPQIADEENIRVYHTLFHTMIRIDAKKQFLYSYYYRYLTDVSISAEEREIIAIFLTEKELLLKDKIIKILIDIYREKGLEVMKQAKYALLNNGIRTNPLSKEFILQESDPEILRLARKVLRENEVRKDKVSLTRLNELTTKEEKEHFLKSLKEKYIHEIDLEKKRAEEERQRKIIEAKLNTEYTLFINKKMGLSALKKSLRALSGYDMELTRIRRNKEDGRKI